MYIKFNSLFKMRDEKSSGKIECAILWENTRSSLSSKLILFIQECLGSNLKRLSTAIFPVSHSLGLFFLAKYAFTSHTNALLPYPKYIALCPFHVYEEKNNGSKFSLWKNNNCSCFIENQYRLSFIKPFFTVCVCVWGGTGVQSNCCLLFA